MDALDQRRKKLMASKLGDLLAWRVPELEDVIGPFDLSIFHEYQQRLSPMITRCETELLRLSDDEIDILVSNDRTDPDDIRKRWAKFADAEVLQLKKRRPPWYAGGFGHPDYQADLAHWARMPSFTLAEATCLSVGVDPKHFSSERLEKMAGKDRATLWPSIVFLLDRYELLQRVFRQRTAHSVNTFFFLDWAIRVEFELPPDFLKLLKRYHRDANSGDNDAATVTAMPTKREIDKIAQLLTAMAIDDYGYDPDAQRNKVHSELADLAAGMGLEIHPDTIRKYLRIGAGFLPEDWKRSRDKSLND